MHLAAAFLRESEVRVVGPDVEGLRQLRVHLGAVQPRWILGDLVGQVLHAPPRPCGPHVHVYTGCFDRIIFSMGPLLKWKISAAFDKSGRKDSFPRSNGSNYLYYLGHPYAPVLLADTADVCVISSVNIWVWNVCRGIWWYAIAISYLGGHIASRGSLRSRPCLWPRTGAAPSPSPSLHRAPLKQTHHSYK